MPAVRGPKPALTHNPPPPPTLRVVTLVAMEMGNLHAVMSSRSGGSMVAKAKAGVTADGELERPLLGDGGGGGSWGGGGVKPPTRSGGGGGGSIAITGYAGDNGKAAGGGEHAVTTVTTAVTAVNCRMLWTPTRTAR